jgi:hypothetical protein
MHTLLAAVHKLHPIAEELLRDVEQFLYLFGHDGELRAEVTQQTERKEI